MDVDQATVVVRDEVFAEHAHEAGENHRIRRETVDCLPQRGIEGVAAGEVTMRNHRRGNAAFSGKGETGGVGLVADHRRHAQAGNLRAHDGLHVEATTGDQDYDCFHSSLLQFTNFTRPA